MNKPIERGPCEVANQCAELIIERSRVGIKKYGVTVASNPLTAVQWLQHHRQELADGLVYATRLQEVIEARDTLIRKLLAESDRQSIRLLEMEAELQKLKSGKRKAKK